jgi:hypothetical protein
MTIHEEFDLAKLRLNPTDVDGQTVKTVISIPVHKPPRHDWIRVHPEESIDVGGIQLKDGDDEFYLVSPDVLEAVAGEVSYYSLFPYINRLGVLRLWPVRLPDPDGKINEWHRTARVAAARGVSDWIRVAANRSLGGYEIFTARTQPPEPKWPDLSLEDMVRIAFHDRGKIIRSIDHPVVKTLAGQL